jgi:hypothetical protein
LSCEVVGSKGLWKLSRLILGIGGGGEKVAVEIVGECALLNGGMESS